MRAILVRIGERSFASGRYAMIPEYISGLHRTTFKPLGFHDAGEYNKVNPAAWAIPVYRDGRWRTVPMGGAHPDEIAEIIENACRRFSDELPSERERRGTAPRDAAFRSVAQLTSTVIGTQPYRDGNHRAGLLTMAAAMHSHHLGVPELPDPLTFHAAIGMAWRSDDQRSIEPLVELVSELALER